MGSEDGLRSNDIKIAFLIDSYRNPAAGTEGQLRLLTEMLTQRGHTVRLGVLRTTEYIRSGAFPAQVDDLQIPRIASASAWIALHRWGQSLVREGFGLVQIFFNDAAIMAPWPMRLAGLRVISSRRDMGYWYSPGVLAGLRLAGRAVDVLLANSHAAGRAACAREWISTSRLEVIHNGIDFVAASKIKDSSGFVPPAPTGGRVGIVANIRPVKRIQDLLAAFAIVRSKHPGSQLVIVGGGDQTELLRQAMVLGISAEVMFTGQIEDPAGWIQTFDVGVICSDSEGLSNTILEYMNAGVPVVATDTGGNPELVTHGETGELVPVRDVRRLAEAISRLLADRTWAATLGGAGRQRAQHEFSLSAMADHHLDLYQRLVRSAPTLGVTRIAPGKLPR